MINFNRNQLEEISNETELNVLDDFIDKMLNLNVIESVDDDCEEYEFKNILYFTYFLIISTFEDV